MAEFGIQVLHLDGFVLVALSGELDICGVPALRDALVPLSRRYDADQVTVDCSHLTFIDARGLGGLLAAMRPIGGPTNVKPHLRGVRGAVMRVLRITGAAARFTIDELADAIRFGEPFDVERADA